MENNRNSQPPPPPQGHSVKLLALLSVAIANLMFVMVIIRNVGDLRLRLILLYITLQPFFSVLYFRRWLRDRGHRHLRLGLVYVAIVLGAFISFQLFSGGFVSADLRGGVSFIGLAVEACFFYRITVLPLEWEDSEAIGDYYLEGKEPAGRNSLGKEPTA